MKVGDFVIWRAVVSNYGHISRIPAVVLSVGPKRVRIQTHRQNRLRQHLVKPENLELAKESSWLGVVPEGRADP